MEPDAKIVSLCQYQSSALPQYTVMWFGIKVLIFDIKGEDKRRKTMHLVSFLFKITSLDTRIDYNFDFEMQLRAFVGLWDPVVVERGSQKH